jgi:hypothetical protein
MFKENEKKDLNNACTYLSALSQSSDLFGFFTHTELNSVKASKG